MKYYTRKEVAKKLNVTEQTVFNRCKALNIIAVDKMFSEQQFERIKNYKSFKDIRNYKKYSNVKINIIDFFLTNFNNSETEIAAKMDLGVKFVSDTISEYLNNDKTIIVISKL